MEHSNKSLNEHEYYPMFKCHLNLSLSLSLSHRERSENHHET